ncbi:MAG: glycosyltransferase, partial [Candidatus Auribacterota bacterium]|nr:glycosyltransferase [Candidatus Auribacterota bacterium]
MRVLYFHQHFSTPAGATGTRSYQMARRLIERGHQVTMVCGSYQGAETGLSDQPEGRIRRGIVDGIEVIEIPLPYSNYDSFFKRSMIFLKFGLKSIGI